MCIHKSNRFIEFLARVRYVVLSRIIKAEPVEHIEYRDSRWYKFDRQNRVVKIAMTYFEVMQPY